MSICGGFDYNEAIGREIDALKAKADGRPAPRSIRSALRSHRRIEQQGSATSEISRSIQDAARGTREVNSNISGVQQAAGQTGQAAQQVLSAAAQLSSQSRDLAGQVNRFLSEVRRPDGAADARMNGEFSTMRGAAT